MEEFEIWELITKYLSGETDEEEGKRLFAWINTNEDNYQFYHEAKQLWDEGHLTFSGLEKDRAYTGLQQKLEQGVSDIPPIVKGKQNLAFKIQSRVYWRNVAASIVILAALTTTGYLVFPLTSSPDDRPVTYVEKHTPKGKKLKTTLPDGTTAWLNANSHLRFPETFPGNERVVFLEGEAYFEVAHDMDRPFTVKSDIIHIFRLSISLG